VSADRCRPKKCRQECKKACPVVKVGTCAVAPYSPDPPPREKRGEPKLVGFGWQVG